MLKKTQGSTMGTWHIRLTGAIRLEWQPVEGKAEIYVPRFTSRAVQALFVYLTIHRANTTRDRLVADLDIAGRDKKRDPRKVLANQLYYLRRDLHRACPDTLPTDTLIQTVRDTMQLASEATVDIASIDDACRLGENHPRLEKALLEAALLDPDQVAPGLRQGWIEAERARLHEKLPQVQRRLAQRQEKVRLETATLLSPQRPIFVGRESFLHDLDSLFDRGTTLVTLLGPSGVGKTRIATEFTRQAIVNGMHRFKRIVFVPLADLKSIPEVISAMGSALDCADGRITEKLQQNPILCVLDNLEHLLSVPEIRERLQGHLHEWLHGTPSAFLITSQTPVGGLAEEVLVNVAPLAIPTSSDTTVKELQKVSSVCLLEELLVSQREKIVPSDHRRDFHLNEKNAFFFRNTCILSGGIPLFLELIVPHTLRAKTFQEIDRALRRDLLSRLTQIHSSTNSDLRHHTMRAAIAWSVALLPIPIHSFLAHLSFFAGLSQPMMLRRFWNKTPPWLKHS